MISTNYVNEMIMKANTKNKTSHCVDLLQENDDDGSAMATQSIW